MSFIKGFYKKHRELILYLLTGGFTTVVSWAACALTLKIGVKWLADANGDPSTLLDVIGSTVQWVVGVLVAFVTNKLFVFTDAEKGWRASAKQLAVFSGSRVVTWVLEAAANIGIIALFDLAGYQAFTALGIEITQRVWAKLITAVFVTVSNYFISKLLVFKKKNKTNSDDLDDLH